MNKLSPPKKATVYFVSIIAVFFIGIAFDLACGPEHLYGRQVQAKANTRS